VQINPFSNSIKDRLRISVFSTHPIQYQVPVWRGMYGHPKLDVQVYYFSDHSLSGRLDHGFGVPVAWDVPLLDGYRYRFLSRNANLDRPNSVRIPNIPEVLQVGTVDWILLHGYTYAFSRQALMRARKIGAKVFLRGEFTDMERGRTLLKRIFREFYLHWFYRKVDLFGYIGSDSLSHLKRRRIPDNKLCFTPYSVDDQLIENQKANLDSAECRRQLGFSHDALVLLFSGKVIERKQPLVLAEAVARLASDRRLCLVILGDGDQLSMVHEKLTPLLGGRLISPGFVNQTQLGRYFRAADVFILPSRFDTWGLVVNEAMHYGLPCIVSDRVGCRHDLISPDETGFVFPVGDPLRLSEVIQIFLDEPQKARIMGKVAEHRVSQYSMKRTIDAICAGLLGADAESLT